MFELYKRINIAEVDKEILVKIEGISKKKDSWRRLLDQLFAEKGNQICRIKELSVEELINQ